MSLSRNLVPSLIQICRIRWWFSFFLFQTRNTFLGKFGLKIKIASWSWNLVPRPIGIRTTQWWCSFFSIFDPFLGNLFQIFKIISWSWILEPRIIWMCRVPRWFLWFFFYRSEIPFFGLTWSKNSKLLV